MRNVFHFLVSAIVLGVVYTPASDAVIQFTADGFQATADTATWNAVDGSNAMTSVHTTTNGWCLAVQEGGTVFFDNGVSSPLGFPDSATNSVSYACAVVECAESVDHAAVIDAPCSIRFIL